MYIRKCEGECKTRKARGQSTTAVARKVRVCVRECMCARAERLRICECASIFLQCDELLGTPTHAQETFSSSASILGTPDRHRRRRLLL